MHGAVGTRCTKSPDETAVYLNLHSSVSVGDGAVIGEPPVPSVASFSRIVAYEVPDRAVIQPRVVEESCSRGSAMTGAQILWTGCHGTPFMFFVAHVITRFHEIELTKQGPESRVEVS